MRNHSITPVAFGASGSTEKYHLQLDKGMAMADVKADADELWSGLVVDRRGRRLGRGLGHLDPRRRRGDVS